MLTAAELSRYGRQLALPELGIAGQERLRGASVLIVGAGGLGSPAALYLAAAGLGVIGIIDDDAVETSNLHRQVLHGTADIGRSKAASATDALRRLNEQVRINAYNERLTPARALTLFGAYDVIVDGSDNYATRYAINDACARLGKVWVYGSVERFSGQVSVFGAPNGPCYRCIFPEPPTPGSTASCEEIGVLGAVPGVVGSLQAVETLKWIVGVGEPLVGRLLQLDLRNGHVEVIRFARRADCPSCATRGELQADWREQESAIDQSDIEPMDLARRLRETNPPRLVDIREAWEWSLNRIGEPQLLAMSQLEGNLDALDRSQELVVYCHHGTRSSMVAEWLRGHGFRARNLAGGIDRWSCEVDSSVPRY